METSPIREEEMTNMNIAATRPEAHVVLEKQLQEFKTQLDRLFHHSDDEIANNGGNLHRKLAFLRTLLSMELGSHPETKPDHLLDVTARLNFLEDAFNNWMENMSEPEHHWLDGPSLCSCTETCFEEDRNATGPPDPLEEEDCKVKNFKADEGADVNQVAEPVLLFEDSGDQESRERRRGWSTSSRFAGGMSLLLMAAIGIAMSYWFHEVEFLVPT